MSNLSRSILRPEQSIPCIAQARPDVVVLVQLLVECAEEHRYIGMVLLIDRHALGCRDQCEEYDILRRDAIFLQHGDRMRAGISRADHWVANDEGAPLY